MHIETMSYPRLKDSVCKCLNIDQSFLLKELTELSRIERESGEEEFNEKVVEFIGLCDLQIPDEIEFYHLGWRLNNEESKESKNLRELVLSENSFSDYLKAHDITFWNDDCLKVFYKGNEILASEQSSDRVANYLRMRLGIDDDDRCVNGFAFRDSLEKDSYWNHLRRGPEFLQQFSEYIEDRNLIDDYIKNSHYFCFEYIVPINDIIIDGHDEMDNKEKTYHLLGQCFRHLLKYHRNRLYPDFRDEDDNVILRLADDVTMKKEWFVSKELITV